MSSVGSEAGSEESMTTIRSGDIVRTGYMKKLKTMKKKFFVLRSDGPNCPACLEYYDTVKKWKNKHPPKRSIVLKNCFSVNRRSDTKQKFVIALYTGLECFGIVLESEEDLQEWLRLLLMYQHREDITDGCTLKPYYEHVWKVAVQKKELGAKHNLTGTYLLCMAGGSLRLAQPAVEEDQESKFYEIPLQFIRRCGYLDTVIYFELGQATCFGSGNLWMQAEDSSIAHHMKATILNCPKKELGPKSRSRSSSANEASKPVHFGRKWPSSGDDSLSVQSYTKSLSHQEHSMSPNSVGHSVSSMGDGTHHHHHVHYNPNLTSISLSPYPPTRRASTGTRPVTTTGPALLSSTRTSTSYTGRDRCDSLPTRPRMTLDALSTAKTGNHVSYSTSRPCSMFNRSILSPPGFSHPTSPTSATYSTDSASSSLSVDVDNENWTDIDNTHRTILEERGEEYVPWEGVPSKSFLPESILSSKKAAAASRMTKCSVGHNSSSNSQSSCSPCSSSPIDAGAYLPMSPIESIVDNRTKQCLNRSYDSMSHSRESSIHDDLGEGYVTMAPLSADAGYMSMDQSVHRPGDLSPGLSSCSIMSGTPSRDGRLSEFVMDLVSSYDKVSSYLKPSDDDVTFNVRQTRAYSTGSKPDAAHNKFIRCDSSEGLRTRAFSVGSKCSKNPPAMLRRTPNSTSASSTEDHIEMDFPGNRLRRTPFREQQQQQLQQQQQQRLKQHQLATKPVNNITTYTLADGYMDMSKTSPKLEMVNDSRVTSDTNLSPPRLSKHLVGRSPTLGFGYSKQVLVKNSPITATSILAKVMESESSYAMQNDADDSYMEMKPGVCDMPNAPPPPPVMTPVIATATNLHARKDSFTVADSATARTPLPHIKQPLLETAVFRQTPSTPPEGYIDMSFKGRRSESYQSPKPVAKPAAEKTPDGYVDMSFRKNSRKNLVDSNSSRKKPSETKNSFCCTGKENQMDTRMCSKPIAIQAVKNRRPQTANLFRRHKSEETQTAKPNFLPLSLTIPTTFTLGRKKKCCPKKEKTESPVAVPVFPLSPDRCSSADYSSLERVDEMVNWDRRCSADYDESAEYIVMTPGVVPKLERKVSEPTCMKYSSRPECMAKEAKDSMNRSLQRSTSVPSTISAARSGRRSPSSSEFSDMKNEVKCKSDSAMNCADRSLLQSPVMSLQKNVNVPITSIANSCSPLILREKVTYVTLDMPTSEQEPSVKSEVFASSSIQSDELNLVYTQIDFKKPSRSSSPSK